MMTCHCCGKLWTEGSRGLDAERRRCANRVSCITRALGPSPAKSYRAQARTVAPFMTSHVHEFVGRLDRWCEVCNRPDRDSIHTTMRVIRERSRLSLIPSPPRTPR